MAQLPRVMADTRQGGALFIVGMHIHDWGKPFDWLPAFLAMPRMIRELEANRALGMVSARFCFWGGRTIAVVQYWKSFELLTAYARSDDYEHRPAWLEFYRSASKSRSTVGLFHETYVVSAGSTESLYFQMPNGFGLTAVTGAVPVTARSATAHDRLHASGPGDAGPQPSEANP